MPITSPVDFRGNNKLPIWYTVDEDNCPPDLSEEIARVRRYAHIDANRRTAETYLELKEVITSARDFLKQMNKHIVECTAMEAKWYPIIRYLLSVCWQKYKSYYQAWRNADKAVEAIRAVQLASPVVTFGGQFWFKLYYDIEDQERLTYRELQEHLSLHPGKKVSDLPVLESSEDEDISDSEDVEVKAGDEERLEQTELANPSVRTGTLAPAKQASPPDPRSQEADIAPDPTALLDGIDDPDSYSKWDRSLLSSDPAHINMPSLVQPDVTPLPLMERRSGVKRHEVPVGSSTRITPIRSNLERLRRENFPEPEHKEEKDVA